MSAISVCGYEYSAVIVGHDTEKSKVTYHVKGDVKFYKTQVKEENLLTPSGKDEEGNDIYTLDYDTPLQEQGSITTRNIILVTRQGDDTVTGEFRLNFYKVGITKGTC